MIQPLHRGAPPGPPNVYDKVHTASIAYHPRQQPLASPDTWQVYLAQQNTETLHQK